MEKFIAATPRPWKFERTSGRWAYHYGNILTQSVPNFHVCQVTETGTSIEDQDNADLIVTAVNSFDDLSKFLRMVNDCLNDGIPIEKNDPIHNVAKQLLESLK